MKDYSKEIQELAFINSKLRSLTDDKKKLEAIIQSGLSEEIDNKNIKYAEYSNEVGRVSLTNKNKLEIDDHVLLRSIIGESLAFGKFEIVITEKVKVSDKNFEKALIALYKGNYKKHDLNELLTSLGLSDKDQRVVLKKLKGDYLKDRELLEQYNLNDDDLEEELDIIFEHKNYELVERYFGDKEINLEYLKRAIYIDETLAFSSKFNSEGELENADQ